MRGAAPVFVLLPLAPLGSAWAEGARAPRGGWAVSERERRAEERSRAATASICQGCMGRSGPRVGRRARTNRPLTIEPLREARGRIRVPLTRAWTPTGSLPVTSRAEAQIQESNRLVAMQLRQMQYQQQTQFELNQLRGELRRAYLFR